MGQQPTLRLQGNQDLLLIKWQDLLAHQEVSQPLEVTLPTGKASLQLEATLPIGKASPQRDHNPTQAVGQVQEQFREGVQTIIQDLLPRQEVEADAVTNNIQLNNKNGS